MIFATSPWDIILKAYLPIPLSRNRSFMSFNLHFSPFRKYSFSPLLYTFLVISISVYGTFRYESVLSNTSVTEAKFNDFLLFEPENITSDILFDPLRVFTDCSPMTHFTASTILLLPLPFGPTIHVILSFKFKFILSAKDLNPEAFISFKYINSTSYMFYR